MIWRRLKNLWEMSAYRINDKERQPTWNGYPVPKQLVKDVPTVEKKLATIVNFEDKPDPFEQDVETSQ
jgi:hypothetical protein